MSTKERAIALLGQGIPAAQVAAACGVSESLISQMLSQDDIRDKVTELRFKNLQANNQRDAAYDSIEDRLLAKLDASIPMMFKPMEILKSIQVINAAKRRGSSAPDSITNQQTVVNVILPTQLAQKFTVNAQNQVINAGGQDLLTIQSGTLLAQVKGESNESGNSSITYNPAI